MLNQILDLCGDHSITKALISNLFGVVFLIGSNPELELLDLRLSIVSKVCAIIAFGATAVVTLPKLFQFGSKILKAISSTFK